MELKTVVLGVGITVLTTTTLLAQPQDNDRDRKEPPTIEELFKEMDKDKDDKLSKKEIKGPLAKDFDKIDRDEDGFITKKEMEKAPKPKRREDDRR